jgi:uncharacterized RDD family membrane protein YckC
MYPGMLRRTLATLIDLAVVICCVILIVKYPIFPQLGWANVMAAIAVPLLYEPVLSACLCTVGQALMGTRVRHSETSQRIGLGKAYLRFIMKYVVSILGAASGPSAAGTPISVGVWSDRDGRSLHDLQAGTVVVYANVA